MWVHGGAGDDSISVSGNGPDAVSSIYGGEGTDSIDVMLSAGATATVFGGLGEADPTDGADTITVSGMDAVGAESIDATSVQVYANGGDDVVTWLGGGTGELFGGFGDDTFNIGEVFPDFLITQNGPLQVADEVTVTGGDGADTYVIGDTALSYGPFVVPTLTITDFVSGTDKIDVSNVAVPAFDATEATDYLGIFNWTPEPDRFETWEAAVSFALEFLLNDNPAVGTLEWDGDLYVFGNGASFVGPTPTPAGSFVIKLEGVTEVAYTDFVFPSDYSIIG